MTGARQALSGLVSIAVAFALVFGPAWTLQFWQGWVYCGLALVCGATITLYLQRSDPELLRRRMRSPTAEKETSQKLIQLAVGILLVGTLVVSSLDHRLSWSHVPPSATLAGYVLFVASFLLIFLAFRENTFAAATIDVEADQKVIASGPYAIVRHPYYLGLLLWYVATPLALGSWWGLLTTVPVSIILVARIGYEERFLTQHLSGYAAYCRSVRYRLIPLVW
jgi:protein-S-isoprenylcysteine O-methyltransferase Ste14